MKKENAFKITVNDAFEWFLTPEAVQKLDLIPLPDGKYHLLYKNQSYKIKLLQINKQQHTAILNINDKPFTVKITDPLEQLIEKMGLSARPHHQSGEVFAPMPGLVLKIEVAEGQTVQKDQTLLILEAMKMENIIKAEGEGQIVQIAVEEGQAVNKGDLLLRIE